MTNLTTVCVSRGEAEPRAGDTIDINESDGDSEENLFVPKECLFHNYEKVHGKVEHLIKRSYEKPCKWFYLVFAPLDINYLNDIGWYRNKGFDHVRKKIGRMKCHIMTKEIMAKKVHINVLCCSDRPLDNLLHEKTTNKYSIYCKELTGLVDREKVLDYILKEAKQRYFHEYVDYEYSKD